MREDMRTAFIANFAGDGVFVRKAWVNARADLEPRAAPTFALDWKPVHTEVAASGELGLSTGPWKLTIKANPQEPPSYGQFVSVWRREPGGIWKVAVDIGISNPLDSLWSEPLAALPSGRPMPAGHGGIEEAERRFADEVRTAGPKAAYERYASKRVRVYREGLAPYIGKELAVPAASDGHTGITWSVERSEVSRSGDFAYARGRYAKAATPDKPLGCFLHVWRIEDGAWRIVLDVENPSY
jgi:ketosteroid isomerase-like protein